jgi:hypothetical protein
MSVVKTSVTLVIGTVLGVALKFAKDFNDDRKIVDQSIAKISGELEAALPGLKAEASTSDTPERTWDEGVSSVLFGRSYGAIEDGYYSSWVKERVSEALWALYNEKKIYQA